MNEKSLLYSVVMRKALFSGCIGWAPIVLQKQAVECTSHPFGDTLKGVQALHNFHQEPAVIA